MAEQFAKLVGFEDLKKKLALLPQQIGRNALRGAVNAGCTPMVEEARRNEMRSNKTGVLQAAIYKKQIPELSSVTQQIFHIGWRKGKRYQAVIKGKRTVNLDAYYGMYLEFGTSKMSARPFMRPAFETQKENTIEAVRVYLEKRIPEEIAKL